MFLIPQRVPTITTRVPDWVKYCITAPGVVSVRIGLDVDYPLVSDSEPASRVAQIQRAHV